MQVYRAGIKVAVLFVLAVVILIFLIIRVKEASVFSGTKTYQFYFDFVGNMKESAPVTYAGFKVGEIESIRILTEDERGQIGFPLEVSVRVDGSVVLKEDSIPQIKIMGFLGTKYIEIQPGSLESPLLTPGKALKGERIKDINEVIGRLSNEVEEIIPMVKETLEKIKHAVQKGDEIVVDVADNRKVQRILEAAEDVMKKTMEIVEAIDKTVEENKPKVDHTISNIDAFSTDLKDTFETIAPKLESVVAKSEDVVKELDALLKDAHALVDENRPEVRTIMNNLKEASEHAKKFLEILHHQPWRLLAKPKSEKSGRVSRKKYAAPKGYIYRKEK